MDPNKDELNKNDLQFIMNALNTHLGALTTAVNTVAQKVQNLVDEIPDESTTDESPGD